VLLLNERLLFFISLSNQSGNFWIQPRKASIGINIEIQRKDVDTEDGKRIQGA
jgi:hypothetical protein